MTIQTYDEVTTMYIGKIFKNITNKNSYNLINQNLQIKILLSDYIFIDNKFFYRNYENEDEILYETKDKSNSIKVDDLKLSYGTKHLDKKYIYNCCKKYRKRKYLLKRTKKINDEITRVNNIETEIKIEIINNLNFKKSQKDSHYRNCENKILGKNSYTKSLFLYELYNINDNSKNKIVNTINQTLNVNIDINIKLEELFIYFTICKILKNIEHYKNYLYCCIDNINKNIFNLNNKYCMLNDILEDRICGKDTELDTNFSKYYIFKDYNTYAIDNKNKCMCLGYVLAFSKKDNEWNVFPRNNSNKQYYVSNQDIENMINFIKECENEGIKLL